VVGADKNGLRMFDGQVVAKGLQEVFLVDNKVGDILFARL